MNIGAPQRPRRAKFGRARLTAVQPVWGLEQLGLRTVGGRCPPSVSEQPRLGLDPVSERPALRLSSNDEGRRERGLYPAAEEGEPGE